jgi:hypothetical protein
MNFKLYILTILVFIFASCAAQRVDVLVIGGGASGTTAGIQASRMGAKTMITEETTWLGGMLTSAGVSAIDGNNKLPSGLFGEFRDKLVEHYGSASAMQTGWVSSTLFEPSVGNNILKNMTNAEKNLSVWNETAFISAEKMPDGWKVNLLKGGISEIILAKVLIDATELGDVAKYCGVKYDIGMEARSECGEDIAPEKANNIVQDLTYVMILKNYGVNKTITKPINYDASLFSCSAQSANCAQPKTGQTVWSTDKLITYGKLPNGKYMINWPIEGNDYYTNIIDMSAQGRKTELEKAKQFSLCFLYYMQTQLGFSTYGLADDEFPTTDKFPMIPYHRESRRIHGLVRLNVNDVAKPFDQKEALYRTGIAVGDYPIDHHHKRYTDWANLPELHFYPVPSYSLALGTLIPKDVTGLIVAEKSISVSNLMNGSTRLQPVVMQIGQAAGALAALSVQQQVDVAQVPVRDVQSTLLNAGGYLLPYLDVIKSNVHFKALQRIGSTGILKGVGKNVGWSNETWFNIDNTVIVSELKQGLSEFDSTFQWTTNEQELSVSESIRLIKELATYFKKDTIIVQKVQDDWGKMNLSNFDLKRKITRKELAVVLDNYINPFTLRSVDISGTIEKPSEVKEIKVDGIRILTVGNHLRVEGIAVSNLKIYNENGQFMKQSFNSTININGFHGYYLLKIKDTQNAERTIKVLI